MKQPAQSPPVHGLYLDIHQQKPLQKIVHNMIQPQKEKNFLFFHPIPIKFADKNAQYHESQQVHLFFFPPEMRP